MKPGRLVVVAADSEAKLERLNIRVSEHEKQLISQAALAVNLSVSHFVLKHAIDRAEAVLSEQSRFGLSRAKWDEFCRALDRSPRDNASLRDLLTRPGVFDG